MHHFCTDVIQFGQIETRSLFCRENGLHWQCSIVSSDQLAEHCLEQIDCVRYSLRCDGIDIVKRLQCQPELLLFIACQKLARSITEISIGCLRSLIAPFARSRMQDCSHNAQCIRWLSSMEVNLRSRTYSLLCNIISSEPFWSLAIVCMLLVSMIPACVLAS